MEMRGSIKKKTEKSWLHAFITPATIYVKAVIPAKAGIQNWTGCRVKSGMTFDMFNRRSNNHPGRLYSVEIFSPPVLSKDEKFGG
jgi:hypothetical protein